MERIRRVGIVDSRSISLEIIIPCAESTTGTREEMHVSAALVKACCTHEVQSNCSYIVFYTARRQTKNKIKIENRKPCKSSSSSFNYSLLNKIMLQTTLFYYNTVLLLLSLCNPIKYVTAIDKDGRSSISSIQLSNPTTSSTFQFLLVLVVLLAAHKNSKEYYNLLNN